MAGPLSLTSTVREVQLFRAGALVTRVAPLPAEAPEELALDGLPLSLDDESVRVAVAGPGGAPPSPTNVRVSLVVPPPGAPLTPPSAKELLAATDELDALKARLQRIDAELGQLGRLGLRLPEGLQGRPPRPAPAQAWAALLPWSAELMHGRALERAALVEELLAAEEGLRRLQRREAEARAGRDSREDAVHKRVLLTLRGSGATELRLQYLVPGARWVPTYVLRMARDGATAQLAIRALVAQRTGEPWTGVKLSLSTAELRREHELPELRSLRIGRAQPQAPRKAWREPPAGVDALFAGLDAALEARPALPPAPVLPPPAASPPPPPPSPRPAAKVASRPMAPPAPAPMVRPPGGAPTPVAEASVSGGMPPPSMAPSAQPMGVSRSRSVAAPKRSAGFLAQAKGGGRADVDEEEEASMDEFAGSAPEAPTGEWDAPTGNHALPAGSGAPAAALLRYADLRMTAFDDTDHPRGKLRPLGIRDRLEGLDPAQASAVERHLVQARSDASTVALLSFPEGTCEVAASAGAFDYRYDAEGPVDVPADGAIHGVPLLARTAPVRTTLIVVPRESTQAVRVASLQNPLAAPLLAGPAEIYLEDEYLTTSPIRTVPAGAALAVGLGVEEALKVARNVHYDEEKHGMLGGGSSLVHRVEIEIASRLAGKVEVEVRERVPILAEQEKEIELPLPEATPPWELYDQADSARIKGGRRWCFELPAGETRKLGFRYTVKIDGKNELVGGNRRE